MGLTKVATLKVVRVRSQWLITVHVCVAVVPPLVDVTHEAGLDHGLVEQLVVGLLNRGAGVGAVGAFGEVIERALHFQFVTGRVT